MNYNEYLRPIYFGLFCLGLVACASKSSEEANTASNSDMVLEQVHPTAASAGTVVTLYGKNFGDSTLTVFFNDTPADSVFNISNTAINAVVPTLESGEKISVTVKTHDKKLYSNGISFLSLAVPEKVRTLYWTTHNLYKGNVNGHARVEVEKLFEDDYPRGLVVDTVAEDMYWGNGFGQVFRGDLKTKEVTEILRLGSMLADVVVDKRKEWIYYIQENAIRRVSLSDTSKHETLFKDRSEPRSLKLSAANDKLYWCEYGALQVLVGSISGGEPTILITSQEGLFGPRAIDLDEENDRLYIVDTPAVQNSSILVSDLKGKNVVKWLHSEDGIGEVVADVAVDNVNGYLYWMNSKGKTHQDLDDGEIMRAKIGGNGKPEIVFQPVNYGSQLSF